MRDIIKNFFLQNDSLKQSILIEKGQHERENSQTQGRGRQREMIRVEKARTDRQL